jgi:hypothetical protein
MATIRGKCWLLLLAACLFLVPGAGQANDPVPFAPLPEHPLYFKRFQPWAGCNISDYEGQHGNQGWFFGVQWLRWWNRAANQVDVGDPSLAGVPVYRLPYGRNYDVTSVYNGIADGNFFRGGVNSFNTGAFENAPGNGARYEFGFVDDNWGWLGSVINIRPIESQSVIGDAEVMFQDQYTDQVFAFITNSIIVDGERIVTGAFLADAKVGYLDGFVSQGPINGSDADTNFNFNFQSGRFWDGDGDGVVDPTNAADILPSNYWDLYDLVRLATVFRTLKVTQRTNISGVELMPFYRTEKLHKGGYFDFLFGIRYFRYDERFNVFGYGETLSDGVTPSLLADSRWLTRAVNDIVGPQLGGRWSKKKGRWILDASGRFMAGTNFQSIQQQVHLETPPQPPGNIGATVDPRELGARNYNTFLIFTPRTVTHTQHQNEFSPLVEVRANVGYQITKALVAQVGWTGLWVDNVARPSSMVQYQLPAMGIGEDNRQSVFLQGLNLGIELNR